MSNSIPRRILTINTGSSSLKAGLYRADDERLDLSAVVEPIGQDDSRLRIAGGDGRLRAEQRLDLPDHGAALRALLDRLPATDGDRIVAIGHRIVHGGRSFVEPVRITAAVLTELRRLVPLAPNHQPQALAAVETAAAAFPLAPQVACFDTAFHRTLPRVARIYPLPHRYEADGIVRYGFHGLSYESVLAQLQTLDPRAATGRLIVAHLGNGASMTAIRDGASIETTMGFTPSGGLVMGTRTGDLDPGVLLHLLGDGGLDPSALGNLVNREGGMRGVSGGSADMRDLLAEESHDPRAADAVALFCYQARKFLGALVAVLGGLDALVFTGGIGEHATPVRARICDGFDYLGLRLDPSRNDAGDPLISSQDSLVTVRLVPSDEDRMIAHHTARLLGAQGGHGVSL
jgi:acetate kinase